MKQPVYFDRYAWKERLFPAYVPDSNLGIIVVIPSFKEENLIQALDSLNKCIPPTQPVLLLVIINEPETCSEQIKALHYATVKKLDAYKTNYPLIYKRIQLPEKKAGVGLARKIGMDEAAYFFESINKDGVIVCYDADCYCESNYFQEIEKEFNDPKFNAGIVFYEHRFNEENENEIINYELYLRYYIDGLRYAGFPFAHQTLGSCIVVKSKHYQKTCGMNTRKAGEDFYFLNKVIPLGGFKEINGTTVFPSSRISDRVPFGTGKAISTIKGEKDYKVYSPNVFEILKAFFHKTRMYWESDSFEIDEEIKAFLGEDWKDQIDTVKSNVSSYDSFYLRFFKWFDAFRVLKFVHFYRDNYEENVLLEKAIDWLFEKLELKTSSKKKELLLKLRTCDRSLDQIEQAVST